MLSLILLIVGGYPCALAEEANLTELNSNQCLAQKITEPNILHLISASEAEILELSPAADINRPLFHLLPLKTELTNEASLPIYLQVFAADPNHPENNPNFDLIEQQISAPASEMDINAVTNELERCRVKLELLQKASICRDIEWPILDNRPNVNSPQVSAFNPKDSDPFCLTPKEYLDFLIDTHRYGKLIALKARYHIVLHDYNTASAWLKTALGISRQLVQSANNQLAMMAAANAASVLFQIELWIHTPAAPSLYRSLQDLPLPFLSADNIDALVCRERKVIHQSELVGQKMDIGGAANAGESRIYIIKKSEAGNAAIPDANETGEQKDILPVYTSSQCKQIFLQIDRFIAILECLEGLRYYAALYDGCLPNTLGEITEIRLPADPGTSRPFIYYRQNEAYILQAGDAVHRPIPSVFQYKIRLIKAEE